MREVTPETAVDYLRGQGRLPEGKAVEARALGWGVSNVVMRLDIEGEPSIVLKQARERLRTKALWISRLERIWIERAALESLTPRLPEGTVPRVLFAVDEDYLFAMTCAPDDSKVWKEQLLAGEVDAAVAGKAGELLGKIHAGSAGDPAFEPGGRFADLTVFDELRIEPFYRTIARVHPDLAPRIEALIDSLLRPCRRGFVHADFSPKNILVHSEGMGITLVDFETVHAGDPAYDLGFFLSHLLLKAVRAYPRESTLLASTWAFWESYFDHGDAYSDPTLVARSNAHACACALARVDGTSPVDYLDDSRRAVVRQFAREGLLETPPTWDLLIDGLAREMRKLPS